MRTTVVTGLLGSGKTTFIRNLLQDRTEKAAVLVNDFGKAGIDGEIIAAGGVNAIELPSGCVCCTLKVDLITTIRKIVQQYAPEHLLIEPSGVASPGGVLEALENAGLPPPFVVGIVDAVEFAELFGSGMYGNFFHEQVERSDAILVNKVDIATEEAVSAAERLIEEINPQAVRLRTVNAVLIGALPLRSAARPAGAVNGPAPVERTLAWRQNHCLFEAHAFKLPAGIPVRTVRQFFDELAQGGYGNVARAKALVQTDDGPWRFDVVFGRVDASRFDRKIADSRLVVIGADLRPDDLRRGLPGAGPA